MWINCDIGERGVAHEIDDAILENVDLINLACGGHAGDLASVTYYAQLAQSKNLKISAHISFPDRENFGRVAMDIPWSELEESLNEQIGVYHRGLDPSDSSDQPHSLPTHLQPENLKFCKPHGALYHAVHQDRELAVKVLQLLKVQGFHTVVGMDVGFWLKEAKELGFQVLREAFAERVYHLEGEEISLSPRKYPWASIATLDEALLQGVSILKGEEFEVIESFSESPMEILKKVRHHAQADTLCIHSDSAIALELAQGLKAASS